MPRGYAAPGTSELIRAYLTIKGTGNPYNIWKFITEWLPERYPRREYVPPTYDSIRKMFYNLRKLGLIVPTFVSVEATIPSMPFAQRKRFYRIPPDQVNNPAWRDPTIAKYYPGRFQSILRLERYTLSDEEINRIRDFIRERGL